MKFVRFVVLVAMTSLPVLALPAVGQQEIDPEHFDTAELAKTAKPPTQPKASSKATTLKSQQRSVANASHGSPTKARRRQAKAENQRIAAAHSTAE